MKITWNQNPLKTMVELDDHEKELFRLKIKIRELEDIIFQGYFHLDPTNQFYDPVQARKDLSPDYWLEDVEGKTDYSALDKRVDMLLGVFLADLISDHCGDCTCVAMSCTKCAAETILGLDTIPKLGKSLGNKIDSVMRDGKTLDEAIVALENYEPGLPKEGSGWDKAAAGYESHFPRWKAEAKSAAVWLKNYRDEHFPEQRRV